MFARANQLLSPDQNLANVRLTGGLRVTLENGTSTEGLNYVAHGTAE